MKTREKKEEVFCPSCGQSTNQFQEPNQKFGYNCECGNNFFVDTYEEDTHEETPITPLEQIRKHYEELIYFLHDENRPIKTSVTDKDSINKILDVLHLEVIRMEENQ